MIKIDLIVIKILAYFLWVWETFKRNKTLRFIIILIAVAATLIYRAAGGEALATVFMMVMQLAYGFVFMIMQFIGIFWFLAKPKITLILPGDPDTLTWDDYYGQPHIVEVMKQWGNLAIENKKFKEMGGVAVRGILLKGPPGTGKTHLAKCMAGAQAIPFYGIDGTGFRAMFWGVDILRMMAFVNAGRKLAKEWKACWLWIDEVDALGSRGAPGQTGMMGGMMGGRMGQGALNRLLTEMDGIEVVGLYDQCQNKILRFFDYPDIDQGTVMFLAATNRPQDLDPALLRPGRFGKSIEVDKPDKASRRAVIEGYLEKITHTGKIDIDLLVQDTATRTPNDIARAFTGDAIRLALVDGREAVTQRDLENALQEQMLGLQNPISDLEPIQKKQIAVHESGHAVTQTLVMPKTKLVRVSIVRRGAALGYMDARPTEDIYALPLQDIVNSIKVSLGGHVASAIVFGEEWSGALSDFKSIENRVMVLAAHGFFGVFPMGPEIYKDKKLASIIQKKIKEWITETKELLEDNRDALDRLTEVLLEKEDLTGTEALEIINAN